MLAQPWETSGLPHHCIRIQNCDAVQHDCKQAKHGGEPEIEDDFLDKLTLYTATLAVPSQRAAGQR